MYKQIEETQEYEHYRELERYRNTRGEIEIPFDDDRIGTHDGNIVENTDVLEEGQYDASLQDWEASLL